MEILYYTYLFILGTLFGSFSSVIISRLKENKSGIISGRSECPKCHHKLGIFDLFPILSYLSTCGKCRYCKTKIPLMYPLLEITLGIFFIIIIYFLIDIDLIFTLNKLEILKLIFYLSIGFFSFIFVIYDLKYLEIPDSILAILIFLTLIALGIQSFFPNFEIIKTLPGFNLEISFFENTLIFISTTISIGLLYLIMLKGFSEIYDILIILSIVAIICTIKFYFGINLEKTAIGSGLIGVITIFIFFFLQILVSNGNWMGGGDLRIGIFMGLIAGISFSFPALMITYFSGSIIGIIIIILSKIKQNIIKKGNIIQRIKSIFKESELNTQIPFGPFLAIGIFGILFFQNEISNLINNYL
ncbi:MAG: prepilin peptidase [Candidatus Gracilibacteria bacterium]|nr:prepilin peptidase [Candidatus Gracilibacteria bacterium]